ncbi:MAG: response regulator [Sulfuricurvum sp.]|nr:response regulator [Sulfuricurvum sp.]
MKKILIVDDNENNRMLLRALLEEYAEDNTIKLSIHEAVNGLEASLIVQDEHFHLIFMDIMMPEMDGIEATKRIRAQDAKTMIVAVSGVDDGDRQQQILRNGAEDYISKPINADVFLTRLSNYLSLIESRDTLTKKFNPSAANLFTQETFSRKLLFYLQNDDELAEFWEYYLLNSNERCEKLSDAIRTVYALGSIGLKLGVKLQIVVEESIEKMFITLGGLNEIDAKIVKLILAKNPTVTDYKIRDDKISIRLQRPSIKPLVTLADEQIATTVNVTSAYAAAAASYEAVVQTTQVYDYMDPEDLMDLKEYVAKLNSLMMVVGGEIEYHEVNEISDSLQNISRISRGYTDSYSIGQALSSMGYAITNHRELFMAKSDDLAPMCTAFGRDLRNWLQLIFVEGATSVHYMDDTIIANAQMIESILTMEDADHSSAAENLDDIFDF